MSNQRTDRVVITNTDDIGNSVASKLGVTSSRVPGRGGKGKLSTIEQKLDQIDQRLDNLENLNGEIEQLRHRIEEIEQSKAKAERSSLESLKHELKGQYREKQEEFERRVRQILDDYRNSVENLKDRFVSSISGREEQFEQVEDEFRTGTNNRQFCLNAASKTGEQLTANYDTRLTSIIESRNRFFSDVDSFIEDREETAATIDSLQTDIPNFNGSDELVVPFWVVGIRKDGQEELVVLPILERYNPGGELTRETPYQEHLREHQTYSYGDMVDAVQAHISRDTVRDELARQEGEFSDPAFLKGTNIASERFIDALEKFELQKRQTASTAQSSTHSTERERQKREVTVDD